MEIHARNKIAVLLLCLTIGCVDSSFSSGKSPRKAAAMQQKTEKIWNQLLSSSLMDEAATLDCRNTAGCFPGIAERWRAAETGEKKLSVSRFVEFGGQWQPAWGEEPGRFGPFLVEENLIAVLVEALGHSDSELRDAACRILAKETPDSLVRNHTTQIEAALQAFPDMVGGALLTGRLGSDKALKTLRTSKELQSGDSTDVLASFGKLGESESEIKLIEAYQKESDPRVKKRLAWYLGYIDKPRSLSELARDLRTPYEYAWNQKARRSFRIHVIAALSCAYPFEPRLWSPVFSPSDDSYYEGIETWAIRVLGTTWSAPRPPFLYEEEVPMARPGTIHK